MADKRRTPTKSDILKLAAWAMRHPILREHYAIGGGAWLTLRLPKSRSSMDEDTFSTKEDISSYRAMMELVQTCKRDGIHYRILRRGEHYCQMVVHYPDPEHEIKVDIGKIWRPIKLVVDKKLDCLVLSPADMVCEKLRCVTDRIEPTDVYDLCRLHETYRTEFRSALKSLRSTQEAGELLIRIQRCFEVTEGTGTKERLTDSERTWMEIYIQNMVKDVAKQARNADG